MAAGIVIVVVILGVLLLGLLAAFSARGVYLAGLAQSYRRLAQELSGRVSRQGVFSYPVGYFSVGEVEATLQPVVGAPFLGEAFTDVKIRWPHIDAVCHVKPATVWSRMGRFFGARRVLAGSPNFDRRWLIEAGSPEQAREILAPAVQTQLEMLRRLAGDNHVEMRLERGILSIRKNGVLSDLVTLRQLLLGSVQVYEQAMLAQAAGVEILAEQSATEAAICKVCGEAIVRDAAVCRSCQTPHHRECWQYFGACSTFGCGETRYRRVKQWSPASTVSK